MKTWLLVKHELRASVWYAILVPLAITVWLSAHNVTGKGWPLLPMWIILLPLAAGFVYREFCPVFYTGDAFVKQQETLEFMFARAIERRRWLLVKNCFYWCFCCWPLLPLIVSGCLNVSGGPHLPSAALIFMLTWLAALLMQTLFFSDLNTLWLAVAQVFFLIGLLFFSILVTADGELYPALNQLCARHFIPLTVTLLALTVWAHRFGVKRLGFAEVTR